MILLSKHILEIDCYDQALDKQPENAHALGFKAVALARVGELDSSNATLEQLKGTIQKDPFLYWVESKLDMMKGKPSTALVKLEKAVQLRNGLSSELQAELYRDIAFEPIFSALRLDGSMHQMLLRYFGADAPQISR